MRRNAHPKSFLAKLLGIVIVIAVIVGSDWAARAWLAIHRPTIADRRKLGSAAYADSAYWGPSFWKEEDESAAAWKQGNNGQWTATYHGQWINIDDGTRATIYQPTNPQHTVYVFGNSAIFGFGVPDQYTIPSQLQLLFNKRNNNTYRVVNLGGDGESVATAWHKLKATKIARGDIVIFYDGIGEVLSIFQHIDVRRNAVLSGQFCNTLMAQLSHLGITQMYCTLVDQTIPAQSTNAAQRTQLVNQYKATLLQAYQYTTQSGAQFEHFLQPHLWTTALSLDEKAIDANPDLVEPGLGELIQTVWPSLQAASNDIPDSEDFTHILDQARREGVAMYTDFAHITEKGNILIAKAIYDSLTLF